MSSSKRDQDFTKGLEGTRQGVESPRLSKNDMKWEAIKKEIHLHYVLESNTLPRTMQLIQDKYGFQAS